MKTYSLCGCCGDKKAFKEDMWSNSQEVNLVYLKFLFVEVKNELSILSSISSLHYESQKNKFFENILEFPLQVCH